MQQQHVNELEPPTEGMDSISVAIQNVVFKAEMKAMMSLDAVVGCTTIPRVVSDVRFVRHRLGSPSRSSRGAADALASTTLALKDCRHAHVRATLADAERALRDVLVGRVQLRVPFGERDTFIAKLKEAVTTGKYDDPLHSQLMNAHKLTFSSVPGRFPTKAQMSSKPRRSRPGKAPTAEASTRAPTPASSEGGLSASSRGPRMRVVGYCVRYYLLQKVMPLQPHLLQDQQGQKEEAPWTGIIDFRKTA